MSQYVSPALLQGKRFARHRLDDLDAVTALLARDEPSDAIETIHMLENVPAELQLGPNCGLVALRCAAEYLFDGNSECAGDVDTLLARAKELGYTKHGEMFSSVQLAALAGDVYASKKLSARVLGFCSIEQENERENEQSFEAVVRSCVVERSEPILIAYDAAGNHSPCEAGGHRAHWALVIGFIAMANKDRRRYVVALHGKSLRVAVWRLGALAQSNAQLARAADKHDRSVFVIPDRLDELRSQCVHLYKASIDL
jgi:actin maturation protease